MKDKDCSIQAVDQRCFIAFDRKDIRSVIECLIQLLQNLKESGLFPKNEIERRETPGADIPALAQGEDERLKKVYVDLSGKPNGAMENDKFTKQPM